MAAIGALVDLTVCVTSMNNRALLERCLDSVVRETSGLSVELLVVDNCSSDGSPVMIRERFPSVRLIENTASLSFCENNNRMFSDAAGQYMLVLNDDAELSGGALAAMLDFMAAHPKAAVLGCTLLNPDGSLQPSAGWWPPSLWTDFLELSRLNAAMNRIAPDALYPGKYKMSIPQHDREQRVTSLLGACLLLRREAVAEVGGYDTSLPCYRNDTDLIMRLRNAGWEAWYTPAARAIHHGGATFRRESNMIERTYRDYHAFYRKHYGPAAECAYRLMAAASASAGLLRHSLFALFRPASRDAARYHSEVLRAQFRRH